MCIFQRELNMTNRTQKKKATLESSKTNRTQKKWSVIIILIRNENEVSLHIPTLILTMVALHQNAGNTIKIMINIPTNTLTILMAVDTLTSMISTDITIHILMDLIIHHAFHLIITLTILTPMRLTITTTNPKQQ